MNNEIDIILSRYFSGEATKKELRTLDSWLAKSDENEKQFYQMALLYQYVGQADDLPVVDTDKAMLQFKNYISAKQKNSRSSFFKISTAWRAAAAVAILLIGTFAVFHFINQDSESIQILAGDTQKECVLFENANVTLFPGSEIVYNTKTNRSIQLKGKAAFVIQSKSKGIVIQAGETFIEDIGTIFTVDATHPDKSISVEVAQGEVKFYTEVNTGVHLKNKENAVYNVQTKQFRILTEKRYAASPQDMIFQDTPLYKAIEEIKMRYGVDVLIHPEMPSGILINASFNKNESLENVLNVITTTISARWLKENNVYVIMP